MKTYDPIVFLYGDEEDYKVEYLDQAKEELYGSPIFYHKGKITTPLTEVFVDPGYHLEMVHPREERLLKWLRQRFADRKDEPIRYYDLKSAIYEYGNQVGERWGQYMISGSLRNLWRLGQLRRFIRGKAKAVKKIGRGESWGVHYLLYPQENK